MIVTLKCLFTFGKVVGYIFNIPVASSRPNNILEMENIFHSSFFFYQLVAKNILKIGVIILFPTRHLDSPLPSRSTTCSKVPNRIGVWKCWFLGKRLAKNPREKPIGAGTTKTNYKEFHPQLASILGYELGPCCGEVQRGQMGKHC